MKIRKLTAVVAVVLASLSVVASAQSYSIDWGFVSFSGLAKDSKAVDLAPGWYNFELTGGASVSTSSLSSTTPLVQLVGLNSGNNIWNYEICTSKVNNTWSSIGNLVGGIDLYWDGKKSAGSDVNDGEATVASLYAEGMRASYWVDFLPANIKKTTASGTVGMVATAVPEPLSILSACAILAPMGFAFRRKRA